MSSTKKEFLGNDLADAISKACAALKTPQEELNIEILHTGSAGIFGLCRQKTHIRVSLKQDQSPAHHEPVATKTKARSKGDSTPKTTGDKNKKKATLPDSPKTVEKRTQADAKPAPIEPPTEEKTAEDLNPETLNTIKADLDSLLKLSGLSGTTTISNEQNSIVIHIDGDDVEEIIGPEARTLDAIQYLLRKIISKKFSEKIMLSLDAGDFRAKRMDDLKEQGLLLAEEVKKSGKTKSIPSLNPSERRIVHMALQGDKEIRSRSVGEGLLKKVLIYPPGKGKKSRPRRRNKGEGNPPSKS